MENSGIGRICRLCLSSIEFELEDKLHLSAIQMINLCLPEMDLKKCSDCAFCPNCFNCLNEIYVFKIKCLQTEEKLRLYLENCDPLSVNLKHIVECVLNFQEEDWVTKDAGICRSCLNVSSEFISIQVDNTNNGLILKNMFMTCIPEMDLNLSDSPIICTRCVDCLKNFYSFKSKCLQTEEEIFSFKGDTRTQLVNLAELVKTRDYKENNCDPVASDSKMEIEPEYISIGDMQKSYLSPEMEIKTEILVATECNLVEKHSETLNVENLKPEIELTEGHFHFVNCGLDKTNAETIEHSINKAEDPNLPIRLQALSENATNPLGESQTWHTCKNCSYQSKWRHHLERHKQVHEDQPNHHRRFKCFECVFVTKYKHALLRHSTLEHGDWFKCAECEYQTKWKRCYNQHLLNHRGGQIWHHCDLCSYKTKWKYHLKRHMMKLGKENSCEEIMKIYLE